MTNNQEIIASVDPTSIWDDHDQSHFDESETVELHTYKEQLPSPFTKFQFFSLMLFVALWYIPLGCQFSVMSQYVYYRYAIKRHIPGGGINLNGSICDINKSDPLYNLNTLAQQDTAMFNVYNSLTCNVPSLLLIIVYGGYSDRYGRKMFIGIAWVAYIAQLTLLTLIAYLDLSLWLVLLAGLFQSLGGSMLTPIFAVLADISTHSNRGLFIGILELVLGISMIIGELLAGVMIEGIRFKLTLLLLTIGMLIAGLILIFCIPETLTQRQLSSSVLTSNHVSNNPFVTFARSFKIFNGDSHRILLMVCLMSPLFFIYIVLSGISSVETLYLLNDPFCWTSGKLGLFRGLKRALPLVGLFFTIGFLGGRCGFQSRSQSQTLRYSAILVIVGLISGLIFYLDVGWIRYVALVPSKLELANYLLFINPVIASLSSLSLPFARTCISQMVSSTEQGATFAISNTIEQVGALLGSLGINYFYKITVEMAPSFVYFLSCGLLGIAVGCMVTFLVSKRSWRSEDREHLVTNPVVA